MEGCFPAHLLLHEVRKNPDEGDCDSFSPMIRKYSFAFSPWKACELEKLAGRGWWLWLKGASLPHATPPFMFLPVRNRYENPLSRLSPLSVQTQPKPALLRELQIFFISQSKSISSAATLDCSETSTRVLTGKPTQVNLAVPNIIGCAQ